MKKKEEPLLALFSLYVIIFLRFSDMIRVCFVSFFQLTLRNFFYIIRKISVFAENT